MEQIVHSRSLLIIQPLICSDHGLFSQWSDTRGSILNYQIVLSRSEDGLTPVHLAAMWGCPEVLQVLLASGGNPWLVDCYDMNAFNYALKEDQEECYKMLRACCNSQPKPSSHSKSPYHLNLSELQRLILAPHTPNSL